MSFKLIFAVPNATATLAELMGIVLVLPVDPEVALLMGVPIDDPLVEDMIHAQLMSALALQIAS